MKQSVMDRGYKVRNTHFSLLTFFITFLFILIMGGLHFYLVLGVNKLKINNFVQTILVISYWGVFQ